MAARCELVLASRWTTHAGHDAVRTWLDSIETFYTCSIVELGIIRISLSPAYGASWTNVQESLKALHARRGYRFLVDDVDGALSPETNWRDTTDAHLVTLARMNRLKLATLDENLITKAWTKGVAESPVHVNLRRT